MDKDLLKGVLILLGIILAVGGVFLAVSDSGTDKARCIADALRSGVAYGHIEKVCRLTEKSY